MRFGLDVGEVSVHELNEHQRVTVRVLIEKFDGAIDNIGGARPKDDILSAPISVETEVWCKVEVPRKHGACPAFLTNIAREGFGGVEVFGVAPGESRACAR